MPDLVHKNVMLENYRNLVSLGVDNFLPEFLIRPLFGGKEESLRCEGNGDSSCITRYVRMDEADDTGLITHETIHIGEKNYTFSECGRVLNQSSKLTQHQGSHTRKEHYKCNKCGKVYNQLLNLNRHRKIHTGGKHYKSKECGKAFTQCSVLNQHQSIHTGEKPYTCKVCCKTFTHCSNLTQHQVIHKRRNMAKFFAKYGKTFNQSCHLPQHQRVHAGERPYKCNK
ncbi:zinc finger protein 85-like [Sagmatias obliquidens]|uniref:zinc finger protein 85-like n=1 Tax=Sagmatias obliquidens TaxID=3371155 RepID=UPI000F43F42D|nr:zinc finger protein 85-like [Lagenorhynchus obliquidens]